MSKKVNPMTICLLSRRKASYTMCSALNLSRILYIVYLFSLEIHRTVTVVNQDKWFLLHKTKIKVWDVQTWLSNFSVKDLSFFVLVLPFLGALPPHHSIQLKVKVNDKDSFLIVTPICQCSEHSVPHQYLLKN